MATMKISTGKAKDAPSVEVNLPEPQTFNDPQWKKWNMSEADVCACALRTVRVDIANGGAREKLRDTVEANKKDKSKWAAPVQAFVDSWKRGTQKQAAVKILDVRGMEFTPEQIEHFEKQGYKIIQDED